jgi:hypothetical protein
LIENKWFSHENAKGGTFGFNEDVRYLSIPKQDNEGKDYAYKSASRALDHVRKNPDILDIGTLFGTPSEGITIYKDAGIMINSGDGSGFMLGYVDEANMNKIVLISDKVYSWDTWNAENYPDAFNYPATLGEEVSKDTGEIINMTAAKAKSIIDSAASEINKIKNLKGPDKIENKTRSKRIQQPKQVDINRVETEEELSAIGQAIDYLDSIGETVGGSVRDWFKEKWQAHKSARQRRTGY